LFNIKLIPADAQLFADCFCLIQGKNLFLDHNIKLIRSVPIKRAEKQPGLAFPTRSNGVAE
jgi:hypothetical protein